VGQMPQWLSKTPEMYAFDQYFSLGTGPDAEEQLTGRYAQALTSLEGAGFWQANSIHSLETVWGSESRVSQSINGHFIGDWISAGYPADQSGGQYWPQVSSSRVLQQLGHGVQVAIWMALGTRGLPGRPAPALYGDQLFRVAEANHVPTLPVLPIIMSWVCVAPAGDDYFEVEAVRGPTAVEFAVGTPRPMGHSAINPWLVSSALEATEPFKRI
jgi:hypothetical protein